MEIRQLALFSCIFVFVKCGYPPIGDEVQPGSVLLPATRRGRYLANIVRRQAVDGTGIKFNKDADRMNAESKKKVDVLSEELLPYIIAEQERRTTLYKRVMTAIQNGEKGVTIAEIRNKPPLIIRKGLMYRCPSNRVPKEPDGSGIIMCESDIEPTPIMYDSCLSAEDKDLYVTDNKYFFCNRHKVESNDLPRTSNGSSTSVYGCSLHERTSLNYTSMKCALEDTDDVVVHYRYYPDRTYKFVTELDPDREVCDNWNPCQIGYIYSLPSPDQAISASDLWPNEGTDNMQEYERDEIVPPIAEDAKMEYVRPYRPYESVPRRIRIPEGYKFDSVWRGKDPYAKHLSSSFKVPQNNLKITEDPSAKRRTFGSIGEFITLCVVFKKFLENFFGQLFVVFLPKNGSGKEKSEFFVTIVKSTVELEVKKLNPMPQAAMEPVLIEFRCQKCRVQGIIVHGDDGTMHNVDSSKYKTIQMNDGRKALQIQLNNAKPTDFGTYMLTLQNDEGVDEIIQALQLHAPIKDLTNILKAIVLKAASIVGAHFDKTITYECDGCELTDVTCNGEPVTSSGRVSIVPGVKMISFNFPSFEDSNACVYMGLFTKEGKSYRKIFAVVENESPAVTVTPATVEAPPYGETLEIEVTMTCQDDCEVEKVTVNGGELENAATATKTRSSENGPGAYFIATSTSITIRVLEFSEMYEGIYMAVIKVGPESVTKTIAEVKGSGDEGGGDQTESAATAEDSTGPPGEDGGSTGPPGEEGGSTGPPGEDGGSTGPPGEDGGSTGPPGEEEASAAPPEGGEADAPPAEEATEAAPAERKGR